MKHVFISRELSKDSAIKSFCETKGIKLTAQPMIDFEQIDAPFPDRHINLVFFTSPRSVQFFLAQHQLPHGVKLAVIGDSTAKVMLEKGLIPDFVGKDSTDPEQTAIDFAAWIGSGVVLIPQSNRSNKTIEKRLKSAQFIPLVVYKTVASPKRISPPPNILIFSSPSNAETYFSVNEYHPNQQVIAFGKTTAAFLKQTYDIPSLIPDNLEEKTLVLMLASIFSPFE